MPIRAERRLRGVWSGRSAAQSSGSMSRSAREPPGRTSRRAANPPPPAWCWTRRRARTRRTPGLGPHRARRVVARPVGRRADVVSCGTAAGRPARPGPGGGAAGLRGRRTGRSGREGPPMPPMPALAERRAACPTEPRPGRRHRVRWLGRRRSSTRRTRGRRLVLDGQGGGRLRSRVARGAPAGVPRTARPRRRPPAAAGPIPATALGGSTTAGLRPSASAASARAATSRRDARGCRQRSVAGQQAWASAGSREPPAPRRPPGPVSTAGAG